MTPVFIGGESFAKVQAFTASGTITNRGGRIVTFAGAASQTLTLPAAAVGSSFEIWNIDTSDGVAISRAGSDTITDNLTTGATTFNIPAGAKAIVECVSAGVWHANYITSVSSTGTFTFGGTGSVAITGVGFRPKIVRFINAHTSNATVAATTDGYITADGTQMVKATRSYETGPEDSQYASTSYCIATVTAAGSATDHAAFASMDADGFTITVSDNTNSITYGYIAEA